MKIRLNSLKILLLVMPFFAQNVFAQTKPAAENPAQCQPELARTLVTTQVDDSKTVTDSDKRIKILLRVADFLWKTDEATARKYFAEAFDSARERFREKGAEEVKGKNFYRNTQDYRFQVVSAVAKRDAKLADKMLDAILADKTANEKPGDANNETNARRLLNAAWELIEVNKPAALQLARRAAAEPLADGATSWHSFLYRVAEDDQTAADQLYAQIIAANQTTARIGDLYFLASYPFGFERTIGVNNATIGSTVPKNFAPNPNLQRQFLNLLSQQTLALAPGDAAPENDFNLPAPLVAVSLWQDLEPTIAERAPDFVERAVAAKTHANSLMNGDNIKELDERRKSNERREASFDKKLAALEDGADEKELDYLIVDLIFSAKTEEELVKAADWTGKIGEESVRTEAANFVSFKRAEAAVKDNRLADAAAHAEKVSELEHRAVIFFRIAEARLKQEQVAARAAEILEDARAAALRAPNGVERAQVLLGTAFYFEKYNQFRAADTLSEAVKTINRLENPNLSASSVVRFIKGKKFGYSTSFDVPGYNFERSFAQVAKKDWNGALLQAENLSDKYLKTLAVIAVVSDCAAATPKREPAKNAVQLKTLKRN